MCKNSSGTIDTRNRHFMMFSFFIIIMIHELCVSSLSLPAPPPYVCVFRLCGRLVNWFSIHMQSTECEWEKIVVVVVVVVIVIIAVISFRLPARYLWKSFINSIQLCVVHCHIAMETRLNMCALIYQRPSSSTQPTNQYSNEKWLCTSTFASFNTNFDCTKCVHLCCCSGTRRDRDAFVLHQLSAVFCLFSFLLRLLALARLPFSRNNK